MSEEVTPKRRAGWPKGKHRQGPTHPHPHGLHKLKHTLEELGSRALDPNSPVGRELAAWRAALVADLGGEENLSTQQLALVDLAVRDFLLLQSVDGWLFEQPKLVNARKRAVFPVVVERTKLADGLTRRLQALGLQRRAKRLPSLSEYVAARDAEHAAAEAAQRAPASPPKADVEPDDVA